MLLVLHESDILAVFGIIFATLLAALFVQTTVHILTRLGTRLRWSGWRLLGFLAVPICVVLTLRTGLTLYFTLLSTAFALVIGATSRARALCAFLVSFALLCALVPQIGPTLHLRMPPDASLWVSHFHGQVALLPTERSGGGPHELLIVHDSVVVTRLPCPSALSAPFGVRRPTRHVVSLADHTHIHAMDACDGETAGASARTHRLALLGAGARLDGVTLRCPPPDAGVCLHLSADAATANVTVEVYSASGTRLATHRLPPTRNCAAAAAALSRGPNATASPLRCHPNGAGRRLLREARVVPPAFASRVPLALRLWWRAPDALRSAHRGADAFGASVIGPAARAARLGFGRAASVAVPFAAARLADVWAFAGGVHAGATGAAANGTAHADWRFRGGLSVGAAGRAAGRAAGDACDVFPGLLSAGVWAWRAESALTAHAAHALVWAAARLGGALGAVARRGFFRPLVGLLAQFPMEAVGDAIWRVALAVWAAVQQGASFVLRGVGAAGCVLGKALLLASGAAFRVAGLYTATTLSAHVFVVLIQTAVLFVGMRNELREMAQREERQPYTSFVARLMGGGVVSMATRFVRLHSVASARYVVAHLAVIFMLIGLSVLRPLTKLYNLTLYLLFPSVSSHVFLQFFTQTPSHTTIILTSVVKGISVVIVDHTIGNFVSHALHELFFFVCAVLIPVAILWSYRHGVHIRIATVVERLMESTTEREEVRTVEGTPSGTEETEKDASRPLGAEEEIK